MVATQYEHFEVVKLLIQAGANVNAIDEVSYDLFATSFIFLSKQISTAVLCRMAFVH